MPRQNVGGNIGRLVPQGRVVGVAPGLHRRRARFVKLAKGPQRQRPDPLGVGILGVVSQKRRGNCARYAGIAVAQLLSRGGARLCL